MFSSLFTHVYALGSIASFKERIKAIFFQNKEDEEESVPTVQTMAVFKPNVVEKAEALEAEDTASDSDMLKVTSGPLRVSSEDVDFPTTDEISVYEVKKGDTLQDVAKLFGVSVNTIIWANDLRSKSITPGTTLVILPITGIKHVVKNGDSMKSLARKYKADVEDIAKYNGISEDGTLSLGDTIIIPDGEIEIIQPKKTSSSKKSKVLRSYANAAPSGFLVRPLAGGRKTQGIHGYNAVDIAATPGTPVFASGDGRVIAARFGGYNGGYGNMIIISHANGIQTVYGHLKEVNVSSGETVSQGQIIGSVGNTGRSTGPHLHFEVRGAKNPF